MSVVEELKKKIKALKLPKHISIRPVLIHVSGVHEAVDETEFFSSIIDFSALLENAESL